MKEDVQKFVNSIANKCLRLFALNDELCDLIKKMYDYVDKCKDEDEKRTIVDALVFLEFAAKQLEDVRDTLECAKNTLETLRLKQII